MHFISCFENDSAVIRLRLDQSSADRVTAPTRCLMEIPFFASAAFRYAFGRRHAVFPIKQTTPYSLVDFFFLSAIAAHRVPAPLRIRRSFPIFSGMLPSPSRYPSQVKFPPSHCGYPPITNRLLPGFIKNISLDAASSASWCIAPPRAWVQQKYLGFWREQRQAPCGHQFVQRRHALSKSRCPDGFLTQARLPVRRTPPPSLEISLAPSKDPQSPGRQAHGHTAE